MPKPDFIRKPNRLALENYHGHQFVFITTCCQNNKKIFVDEREIEYNLTVLREMTQHFHIALWAYCFMPDHVHFLLEGLSEDSDILLFLGRYKQLTGYSYKQRKGIQLWQKSSYDHILRKDEAIESVVWYILTNPVRNGMVKEFQDYPYLGSWVMDINKFGMPTNTAHPMNMRSRESVNAKWKANED
jgi:putative transposase